MKEQQEQNQSQPEDANGILGASLGRRKFLTGASLAGAGTALASLVGCKSKEAGVIQCGTCRRRWECSRGSGRAG